MVDENVVVHADARPNLFIRQRVLLDGIKEGLQCPPLVLQEPIVVYVDAGLKTLGWRSKVSEVAPAVPDRRGRRMCREKGLNTALWGPTSTG
jgi:hypothetical protein